MYRPLSCLKNTSELAMSKIVLQLDKRCQVKPISTKPWEVKRTNNSYSTHSSLLETVGEDMLEEEKEELANLTSRFLHSGTMAHQVLVIVPYVKSGAQRKVETNSTLMVSEAEALVRTLEWKVVDSIAIGLSSFKKKYLFGTGNLERLRALVIGNDMITAPLPANSCSTASARGPV